MFDPATISKAIAGGLVVLVVGFLAKYGFTLSPLYHDFLGAVSYSLVFYLVGHVVVYLSPANKAPQQ